MQDWIRDLYRHPDMLRMGHAQRLEDLNLGLGWLYYALARIIRGRTVVVIGSYRGFAPMVLAKALADNLEGGRLVFIDPSLVDDFWKDPEAVRAHFAGFGIRNIEHAQMTTQEFVKTDCYRDLEDVGLVFIDGYHTDEQARFDHEAFSGKLANDGIALFHDSIRPRLSRIYGSDKTYEHTVYRYMDELKKRTDLQCFDFPFDSGLTLVRKGGDGADTGDPQD
ncbi:MAG: class I SAM-dependent methyltransferase [Akkermansiaceae bacterium]|nr:class I SAM-dependent methyltransferase [Akkermansiaceae bacterium]NNM30597.1 class I SAM-dependent methyltransferase [Akkermansiaceae bacterium]